MIFFSDSSSQIHVFLEGDHLSPILGMAPNGFAISYNIRLKYSWHESHVMLSLCVGRFILQIRGKEL